MTMWWRPYATKTLRRRIGGSVPREIPPDAVVVQRMIAARTWLQDAADGRVQIEPCAFGWARDRVPVALSSEAGGNDEMTERIDLFELDEIAALRQHASKESRLAVHLFEQASPLAR
jgi:hypothetical protein